MTRREWIIITVSIFLLICASKTEPSRYQIHSMRPVFIMLDKTTGDTWRSVWGLPWQKIGALPAN